MVHQTSLLNNEKLHPPKQKKKKKEDKLAGLLVQDKIYTHKVVEFNSVTT
jgi:hypothetical protein